MLSDEQVSLNLEQKFAFHLLQKHRDYFSDFFRNMSIDRSVLGYIYGKTSFIDVGNGQGNTLLYLVKAINKSFDDAVRTILVTNNYVAPVILLAAKNNLSANDEAVKSFFHFKESYADNIVYRLYEDDKSKLVAMGSRLNTSIVDNQISIQEKSLLFNAFLDVLEQFPSLKDVSAGFFKGKLWKDIYRNIGHQATAEFLSLISYEVDNLSSFVKAKGEQLHRCMELLEWAEKQPLFVGPPSIISSTPAVMKEIAAYKEVIADLQKKHEIVVLDNERQFQTTAWIASTLTGTGAGSRVDSDEKFDNEPVAETFAQIGDAESTGNEEEKNDPITASDGEYEAHSSDDCFFSFDDSSSEEHVSEDYQNSSMNSGKV